METVEQVEHQHGGNPADRPLGTLDNNIVIAIRNNDLSDPVVQPARQLLALNRAGVITINVTLSTALEEQRPDAELKMHEYAIWFQEQGIAPSNIFTSPRTIGFHVQGTSPNTITFDAWRERALNERIHQILFPEVPFSWFQYRDQECTRRNIVGNKREALLELDAQDLCRAIEIPKPAFDSLLPAEQEEVSTLHKRLLRRWRNAKNDALGLYAHLTQAVHTAHSEQAVFVTNDHDFLRPTKLAMLRELGFPGEILRTADAVAFLCNVTGVSLQALGIE
jgi:hypothetical protein